MSSNKVIKVIKIIDDSQIVLNIGSSEGAYMSDIYEIFTESSEDIIDYDTGKKLGKLKLVKGTVTPKYVDANFCVCVNSHKHNLVTAIGAAINDPFFSVPAPLPVNSEQISGGYEGISNQKICLGDIAKKIN